MSNTIKLNKIKRLLGLEIALEQIALENGAVLEAEAFEPGQPVFVIAEDERIPVPVGEYELPDGSILVVEEEGIIASFGQPSEEQPAAEEEMEVETSPKKVVESIVKESHFSMEDLSEENLEKLADAVFNKLESKLSSYTIGAGEMDTTELEAKLAEDPKEIEVLAEEIKPEKHNPETVQELKLKPISNKKPQTIQDRVFAKLSQ